MFIIIYIYLTEATAAQGEVVLSHRSVRGLHFLAVVFVSTIVHNVFCLVLSTSCCVIHNGVEYAINFVVL